MIDIPTVITKARAATIRRHAHLLNWWRDIWQPHVATWKRDAIVTHKQGYDEYLASDYWQGVRYLMLKAAGFKCQECGANDKPLHVHHLTYQRLGRERDEDLVVLCESCHRGKHGIDK
jgi:5-methylcytosine-specific restriction endonuclease McrA